MKTQEQIRKEVIDYLDKTSLHVFIKPKSTFDWKESKYNYDYSDYTHFKIIKMPDGTYKKIEDNIIRDIDYEYYIKNYNENAKCVIKHTLFLNKKVKSIKSTKLTDEIIDNLSKKNSK